MSALAEELADRLAVGEVIVRYATSVDARDMARYATCFTPDVVVTGFGKSAHEGLGPYLEYVTGALGRFGRTQHLIGNQEISIDGNTAHMRSYVQATHELAGDAETLVILWAVYDDDLVRTPDGWKIKRHHLDRQIGPRRVTAL
jgi:ketosteroid isomerase-like protein